MRRGEAGRSFQTYHPVRNPEVAEVVKLFSVAFVVESHLFERYTL